MRKKARFCIALLVAFALMMAVRVLCITLYTIEGDGLQPVLLQGDRVLVNRWSYGLRIGGHNSVFDYGRIGRQPVRRGDLVAFENPQDSTGRQVFICRCKALPGDIVKSDGTTTVVPAVRDCANADYYWLESLNEDNPIDSRTLGFISEEYIIGRAVSVVYSHDKTAPVWRGWRLKRLLMPL